MDANAASAGAAGEQHGVPAVSLDDALADHRIVALAIATPAASHYDVARRAILAGKHVLVEKPLALTLKDGEALRREAEAAGIVLMVGHLLQYHPAYRRLRALVADGAIGELRYAYSNRLSMGKLRVEEDVAWSFAPHDISMVLGLAGGEEPATVAAHVARIVSRGAADSAHLHLTFPSGLKGHVFASWVHPFKEHRLVAVGERACLVFDDGRPEGEKLVLTAYEVVPGPALVKGEAIPVAVEPAEPLREECSHFLASIARRTRPVTGVEEALAVLRVLTAADASLAMERRT